MQPFNNEAELRQRLYDERERLQSEIFQRTQGDEVVLPVEPVRDSEGMTPDDADAVADADRTHALARNSGILLREVNAALQRLDAGTYGTCVRCGRAISPRRLEVLPYASLCIECQEAAERGGPGRRG
ncbi:MAG TPA: TraR/DksA C4-type zinc finger protein [Ktedonobacterales bacterium]|jgi:RNA polymerase-binding transcription factor DksA|nr:TraR/DksA C4-type zinc finger protein [Ktedonobacterales bacterium]